MQIPTGIPRADGLSTGPPVFGYHRGQEVGGQKVGEGDEVSLQEGGQEAGGKKVGGDDISIHEGVQEV